MAETALEYKKRKEAGMAGAEKDDKAAPLPESSNADLAAASRKAKKEPVAEAPESTFAEAPPTPPGPDAGLAEQAKYQKAKRDWEKRKAAAGLTAGKQAEAVK